MAGEIAYLPGKITESTGVLARFLPSVPEGVVSSWLHQNLGSGSWILDPFGTSPKTILEAAAAGFRVLVTANNPIDRLIIALLANPPSQTELQAALAELGSIHKGSERLEPHIRGLYHSTCIQCGQPVMVESFIWQREAKSPTIRSYQCPNCGKSGEFPVTKEDQEYASQFAGSGQMHRARALERVTPLDDPDRANVEQALDVYLPRAIYALISVINKLESFPQNQQRALSALLISAFDQTNNLWPYPPVKTRPRQLSNPTSFRELNVWCALESAMDEWGSHAATLADQVVVRTWPDSLGGDRGVLLYPGRLREFKAENIEMNFDGVVTVMPRYNQAYWTLSTLWAGWLGGRENAAKFKTVLHRRRYDWGWHIGALQAAQSLLSQMILPDIPILALISEAGPEFLTTALLSARLAQMDLIGIALRNDQNQAQVVWQKRPGSRKEAITEPSASDSNRLPAELQNRLRLTIIKSARNYLEDRGEPARYATLLAACLSTVARAADLEDLDRLQAAEALAAVNTALQQALSFQNGFIRFSGSPNSMDAGWWWIQETSPASKYVKHLNDDIGAISPTPPLADRVEIEVVRYLNNHPASKLEEIDQAICSVLTGLLTPDSQMIAACIDSYADPDPKEQNLLSLRKADLPKNRRADLAAIARLLLDFGQKLGYHTSISTDEHRRVIWQHENQLLELEFYLTASAVLGKYLANPMIQPTRSILVYPGSRAGLIASKLEQNPQIPKLIERGWRLVKFRHLRRLAANEQQTAVSLLEQLELDPVTNRDQQISLL
jgi:hypothetical protein